MRDVYPPTHWAIRGTPPAYDTPDEDVYLTGRNLVLLAKAGMWCAQHGIGASSSARWPATRSRMRRRSSSRRWPTRCRSGSRIALEIDAPFRELHKEDVIARGAALGVPFELTLSCMNPRREAGSGVPFLHCGACSKCRERRDAFRGAGMADPAPYA